MVNIIAIDDNDIKTFIPKAVTFMQEYYGSTDGLFYKYEVEGNIYFFNRNGSRIVVMWEFEDEFYYTTFYIDENYNVTDIDLNEFTVNIAGDDLIFYVPNTPIEHYLFSVKNLKNEIYNTTIVYTQWNKETDDRLSLFYNYIMDEDKVNLIYDYQIETPVSILYDKNTSKLVKRGRRPFCSEKYILLKSMPQDIYFDKFKNKSSEEDKENLLQRYLKWYGFSSRPITLFPFTEPFTREEMFSKIESLGFRTCIPQDIIDSNNEGLVNLEEFDEIAKLLKIVDNMEDEVSVKLVLKPGDKNGNC